MNHTDIHGMALALGLPSALAQIEAVKQLVAEAVAAEREACAKVCEEMRDAWVNRPVPLLGYAVELDGAAIAIRARGEA